MNAKPLCVKNASAILLTGILAAATSWAEVITSEPDAYLNYIEANGTQYIDTGVNAETGLKARVDIEWGEAVAADGGSGAGYGDDWSLLDARNGDTRLYLCHLNHNVLLYGYSGYGYTSTALSRKTRYEIVTDFSSAEVSVLQVYLNGAKLCSGSQIAQCVANGNLNLNLNLYIFACNRDGEPNWYARGKLYGLKIMKKNIATGEFDMIRNFVPGLKDGRAGLYDTVESKMYFSFTANDFAAGEVLPSPCEMVEWIESNHPDTNPPNNYIDTRVYGKSGLKSEVDCSIRSGFTADKSILACRTSGGGTATRFFMAYIYSGYFVYAYKSGYWGHNGGANPVPVQNDASARHLIESEFSTARQSVKVDGVELNKNVESPDTDYFCTGATLTLFGLNTAYDGSVSARSCTRLYSAKIWDGDELLRDFVPCVDSSGQAGLYDRVTRRVFKSSDAYDLSTQVGACTNAVMPEGALPDCKIGYIESDGSTDYFDLDVIAKDGVEMEAVMEWMTVPNDGIFTGASDGSNRRFFLAGYSTGSKFYLGYVSDLGKMNGSAAETGVKYMIVSRIDGDQSQSMSVKHQENGRWVWDGDSDGGKDFAYAGPFVSGRSLYLFARNNQGTPDYFTKTRVYRLKLRVKQQDGSYAPVRDLVPVKYGGLPMLYDKISKRFFQNRGRYLATGGGAERKWHIGTILGIR